MLTLNNNENFFQTILEATGNYVNLLKRLAGTHHAGASDRQAFGEDTVVAGGVEHLSHIYLFLVLHIIDKALTLALSLDCSVNPVLLRGDSGAKRRIGDQHH